MQNSMPDNQGGDLIDQAVASIRQAPLPQGPSPLTAQRTISALWAAELEAERNRSRWVVRIAAAIVIGVCAAAMTLVLIERQPRLAQAPDPDRTVPVGGHRDPSDSGSGRNVRVGMTEVSPAVPTSEIIVTGHVYFEGTVPPLRPIDLSSYPQCARDIPGRLYDDSLVVNDDGTLSDVVVSIAGGLPGHRQYEPPAPAILEQKYYTFVPHVLAMMTGQELLVRNMDRLPHNPVATDALNAPVFNFVLSGGQQMGLEPFTQAQTLRLSCELYPWMHGYMKVFDHPYFDVTRGDGAFAIRELPAGTYRLTAWHPKLGTIEKQVTVHGGEPLVVDFTFQGR